MKTCIYIDGFNLYYSRLKGTPFKWLDIASLFRDQILSAQDPSNEVVAVKFFTAPSSQRNTMPFINIKLARRAKPATRAQKAALIAGVTRLMVEVLDKRAQSVVVIIDEVDADNWGEGGEPVSALRKRRSATTPG